MNTATKTIGFNDGCRTVGRHVGRNASAFLSTPCRCFEMPPRKRSNRTAGTRTVTRQNSTQRFDEEMIARYPLGVRIILGALTALTVSGVIPMALAALLAWMCGV